jgi:hypothetical protein
MAIDLEHLYSILASVARQEGASLGQITYSDLSQAYLDRTGEWHEPHGSWDQPLGDLNLMLHALRWPPLSAVVVLKDGGEPGGLFWESCPSIPPRHPDEVTRIAMYSRILERVLGAPWPEVIPTAPPPR